MKLLLLLGSVLTLIWAHGDEEDPSGSIQSCDTSNENFTEAFYGREIFPDHLDDDTNPYAGLDLPKFEYVSCNITHFTVKIDGVHETYPLSIYQYEECFSEHGNHSEHDHDARRRLEILSSMPALASPSQLIYGFERKLHGDEDVDNCYYAICASREVLDNSTSDHDHARLLHDGEDHHGDGDDDLILVTAHVEMCCDAATHEIRLKPHHYCEVADFWTALQEVETGEDKADPDPTIPIAIGAVAAFALVLVGLAFFAPSGEVAKTVEVPKAKPVAQKEVDVMEAKLAAENDNGATKNV